MKLFTFLLLILTLNTPAIAQNLTGTELLDKAIAYHDPNGNWESFKGTLKVIMEAPNNTFRKSEVTIDLPNEYFFLSAVRDSVQTRYTINKGKCNTSITDSISGNPSRTPCETASLYKNYYTYLYGLPMKLKDPGTVISDKVGRKKFKGKEYLVISTIYAKDDGKSEVWFFYFNPKTYALEIYQFYKGDPENEVRRYFFHP
jgi:hypothetical protein